MRARDGGGEGGPTRPGPDPDRTVGEAVLETAGAWLGRAWRAATDPLRRWWHSEDPLEDYALVHLPSIAGDALVGLALADSVFFSIPDVGEARTRVALYLALTMAPLAVAAPALVPLLDRGGFRRAISAAAGAGRALACIYAAPRVDTLLLFPAAFVILVLSRVHGITKNGLTAAYAPAHHGLLRSNAWLARVGIAGALAAILPGLLVLRLAGPTAVLYLAAVVYGVSALLNLRLEQPDEPAHHEPAEMVGRGRIPGLAVAAAGTGAGRAAAGYLLFLVAFALRRAEEPAYWTAVLMAGAMAGGLLGNVLAPRLRPSVREESVVLGALVAAGAGALVAFFFFSLPVLALFAVLAGAAAEFGRLSFQSLMQRLAPGGAHGRVFVRYEVAFQLAWVAGAFVPAMLPIRFRPGVVALAVFYLVLGLTYMFRPDLPARVAGKVAETVRPAGIRLRQVALRTRRTREGRASMEGSVRLGRADEHPEGEIRTYRVGERSFAVAATGEGWFAIDDTCTHQGCSLGEGDLEGATVYCPCHMGHYDLRTGEVLGGPPPEGVAAYQVTVEDGEIHLRG